MTFSNTKPGARSNGVADELLKPFETYHWIRDWRLLPQKKNEIHWYIRFLKICLDTTYY